MTAVELVLWNAGHRLEDPVEWPWGAVRRAPFTPAADLTARGGDWSLFWDPRLGPPPTRVIPDLVADRADVVHAGLLLGMAGLPRELDLIQPQWWFAVDPPPERQAMSWRASARALLVRAEVFQALGGLDRAYRTMAGAGLDFGWRCLARGAVVVHDPRLLSGASPEAPEPVDLPVELPAHDRFLFLLRHYPAKWARYAAARRCAARAFRAASRAATAVPPPRARGAVYERPSSGTQEAVLEPGRVSVVLPTLGRPELVAQVLDDLRHQTVPPSEVVVVDQSPDLSRTEYERFADLPLEVVRQDGTGQWLARNTALARTTGELLLFLDDDSRIEPDFIERHLEALAFYRADVSAGASLSVVGAPVPESYGYFRAADQFDSGNALVRRRLLEQVGGFDRNFDRMRGGDAEFGTRAYLAGALLVHNPLARRSHLKAATGGLRAFGSWDTYRQRGLLTPKPLPSVVYYSLRYFSPRQTREGLLIGLAQSAVPYHLKRRATGRQWAGFLALELLRLPLTAVRVARSLRSARRMLARGPHLPGVDAAPP